MPTHSTLRDALASPERKHRYVARLFDTIAPRYDFITRLLSYGRDRHWKRRLIELAAINPGQRVLDLACGTGDLTFAAAERHADAIGLDFTPRMIRLACARAHAASTPASTAASTSTRPGPHTPAGPSAAPAPALAPAPTPPARFLIGDMMALPLPASSVDIVTTGYGLRNVPVLPAAIAEMHRVLRPGGRLLSLDFNRPRQPLLRAAYLTYLTIAGSLVGLALHGDPDTYRYIPESIKRYPGAEGVVLLLQEAGFRDARWIPVLGGLMAIHIARK
jgi:demethylmenaquinone methyltransferase/2-methoxy-6-polyprenyl-1,4-benzoquinol methylase